MRVQHTTIPAHRYQRALQSAPIARSTSSCAPRPQQPSFSPLLALPQQRARSAAQETCQVQ